MPSIFHYTNFFLKGRIVDEGLKYGARSIQYSTLPINKILNTYKPDNIPEFIDRNKCIFFYPCPPKEYKSEFGVRVNTNGLDISKLFAFDFIPAHRIWCDTVDAQYTGEYSGIPLETSAKEYWNSIMPYSTFEKTMKDGKDIEILYFDYVPPQIIHFINDQDKIVDKLIKDLNGEMEYEFRSGGRNAINIFKGNQKICSLWYIPKERRLIFQFVEQRNLVVIKIVSKLMPYNSDIVIRENCSLEREWKDLMQDHNIII